LFIHLSNFKSYYLLLQTTLKLNNDTDRAFFFWCMVHILIHTLAS